MEQESTASPHQTLNTVTDKTDNRQILPVYRRHMNIHAEITVRFLPMKTLKPGFQRIHPNAVLRQNVGQEAIQGLADILLNNRIAFQHLLHIFCQMLQQILIIKP